MDDKKFDDIIKSKVVDYEEPGFDPASLAALHHQMAAQSVDPWYVRHRAQIITSSTIAFCTLLVLIAQWSWNKQQAQLLKDEIMTLKSGHDEIDNLQDDQSDLKSAVDDTILITEIRREYSEKNALLVQRINHLEVEVQELRNQLNLARSKEDELPLYNEYFQNESQLSVKENGSDLFSKRLVPQKTKENSGRAVPEISVEVNKPLVNTSLKTIRDIEKHYHKGLGIRIGPAVEISDGVYSAGIGQFALGYGVVGDLILSPSLSLETGAKYFKRYYAITDQNELNSTPLPGVDESLGELQKAEIDYGMLEVPINLKYRYPVSLKTHLLASVGYSSTIYFNQIFEYSIAFNDGSGGDFMVNTGYQNNKVTVYPGMLNFSIGLSEELKNRKSIEAALFYQHGLGETGIEKIIPHFFGIRGVYWFTLK
ncbi:MAG TPA: hypothetical protein VFW11_19960 [Cyclobacteriaceae bacterium]|nr:hypothetical protein [Cyclobacteriaceae bacterium]